MDALPCPECDIPAIPAKAIINGHPVWCEDQPEIWCPGCGLLLCVFITGDDENDEFVEARVVEHSGKDWREALEEALGLESDRERGPEHVADIVREIREIGNRQKSDLID